MIHDFPEWLSESDRSIQSKKILDDLCFMLSELRFTKFRVLGYKDVKEFDEMYNVETLETEQHRLDHFDGSFFSVSFKSSISDSIWFRINFDMNDLMGYELINIQTGFNFLDDAVKKMFENLTKKYAPSQYYARKYDV